MSISYLYSSVLETKKTARLNKVFKETKNHHIHPNVEKPLPPVNIVLKFLVRKLHCKNIYWSPHTPALEKYLIPGTEL